MHDAPLSLPNLDVNLCRIRQARLQNALTERGIDAALIADRRHVYYLSGFWCRSLYSPLFWLQQDGNAYLSAPYEPSSAVAADIVAVYESNKLGTLVDDQMSAAQEPLQRLIVDCPTIGVDVPLPIGCAAASCVDLRPSLWSLRRSKDIDEVEHIRFAVKATEAAYEYAIQALRPGLSEVDLFSGIYAAIAEKVGEPFSIPGNDFQIGSPGGLPRRRAAEGGEIAVLDLAVNVRGYTSDLCRSFVVGRQPDKRQLLAQQQIGEVLESTEERLQAGVSCRQLFNDAAVRLEGFQGWHFGHHLGHGIGLSAHEAPRLNPHWNDELQVGDVLTLEPGLYGASLRAGMRVEQIYYLTERGAERLSTFPIAIA